ncbi:hypothetical protein H1O16_gp333 [Burkholderia phage BcepSaruman]|uniref:Uncharacterized protein n=1 Tax=Burkholderia phage BcepSaruman TaxID=2530032 RepID=A0A4D5ZDU2_9CAUD|nr:hypothetical protein H1O16_gp333 [Burkholderia phage BcepSaruman]QBX06746.1 hypothetical protein BcepSaruman_333 [Burkholderia phage BcepSaruman]
MKSDEFYAGRLAGLCHRLRVNPHQTKFKRADWFAGYDEAKRILKEKQ